ncbi:unnamed protein product [Phytophthora lilii]|uniref:Unnamed protein product n=1 Tax=Phytophthora lilii TaxID=2077276 RepID=A0A9W6WYT4_9STRA|nr:unnamed protein product [Phytophthora lilii]
MALSPVDDVLDGELAISAATPVNERRMSYLEDELRHLVVGVERHEGAELHLGVGAGAGGAEAFHGGGRDAGPKGTLATAGKMGNTNTGIQGLLEGKHVHSLRSKSKK